MHDSYCQQSTLVFHADKAILSCGRQLCSGVQQNCIAIATTTSPPPLSFLPSPLSASLPPTSLECDACLQDAWSALGAPSSTFSKHSTSAPQGKFTTPSLQQHSDAASADYFYNYFDRYGWCWEGVIWPALLSDLCIPGTMVSLHLYCLFLVISLV